MVAFVDRRTHPLEARRTRFRLVVVGASERPLQRMPLRLATRRYPCLPKTGGIAPARAAHKVAPTGAPARAACAGPQRIAQHREQHTRRCLKAVSQAKMAEESTSNGANRRSVSKFQTFAPRNSGNTGKYGVPGRVRGNWQIGPSFSSWSPHPRTPNQPTRTNPHGAANGFREQVRHHDAYRSDKLQTLSIAFSLCSKPRPNKYKTRRRGRSVRMTHRMSRVS